MCDHWVNGFCTLYGVRCQFEDDEQLDCEDYSEDDRD